MSDICYNRKGMSSRSCGNVNSFLCDIRENTQMGEQEAYREWIARGLEKPGKQKSKLAAALSLDPSAVTRILDGSRKIHLEEIPKITAYLGDLPPSHGEHIDSHDVAASLPSTPQAKRVKIKGYVGAGSEAHFYKVSDEGYEEVEAPNGATDQTVAVEIKGTSWGPRMNTWLVFYDDVRSPITSDLLGEVCVVGLADDRILIKEIKRNRDGSYTLLSNSSEDPIENAQIEWAAKVTAMRPR